MQNYKNKINTKENQSSASGKNIRALEEQPCISLNKSLNVDMWE